MRSPKANRVALLRTEVQGEAGCREPVWMYRTYIHVHTYMCRRGIVPSPTHVTRRPTAALGSSPQHNLLLPHYKPPFAPSPPSPITITTIIITITIIIITIILDFEVSSLPFPKKPPPLSTPCSKSSVSYQQYQVSLVNYNTQTTTE